MLNQPVSMKSIRTVVLRPLIHQTGTTSATLPHAKKPSRLHGGDTTMLTGALTVLHDAILDDWHPLFRAIGTKDTLIKGWPATGDRDRHAGSLYGFCDRSRTSIATMWSVDRIPEGNASSTSLRRYRIMNRLILPPVWISILFVACGCGSKENPPVKNLDEIVQSLNLEKTDPSGDGCERTGMAFLSDSTFFSFSPEQQREVVERIYRKYQKPHNEGIVEIVSRTRSGKGFTTRKCYNGADVHANSLPECYDCEL